MDKDYTPNSNKFKKEQQAGGGEERKKVEKVISGTAKTKKKTEMRKFADVFISEDVANVKSYVIVDVLIPAIKKAVFDIVTNGIEMFLYGEKGNNKRRSTTDTVSYRDYNRAYDRKDYVSTRVSTAYTYDDITIPTRGEAEKVLSSMDDILAQYGTVSVADLFDLVGITGNYTDNRYGWTDLRGAYVARARDGYVLKLPRVIPL